LKRLTELYVALPASTISDVSHLRERTFKIGLIGRALAIFRVDEVIIFRDCPEVDQSRDADLIATILSYMETPQYLRKLLFKIRPELRYAGILPPLRTPHHPLMSHAKNLKVGEFREGVVISSDKKGIMVEVGVENPILIPDARVPVNTRVTVKIVEAGKRPEAILTIREEIQDYWGYKVIVSNGSLGKMMKESSFDLVVATSRCGSLFLTVADELIKRWRRSRRMLVAFGAPTQGLQEILMKENLKLNEIADFVVNTIPHQATETVRTEEALYATLSILNILIDEFS